MEKKLPAQLARCAMMIAPAAVLASLVEALVRKMEWRHPRLFKNLMRLDRAVVHVEPSDVPHRFALTFGEKPATLRVIEKEEECNARIRGSLESLFDMLEGRTDGDALFFSRNIEVTGETAVIVALRNTLDREEINLLEDITSFCGPFAEPAQKAIVLADHVAGLVMERLRA